MLKNYIESVKPISKEEAISLFKINRKHKLNNEGWFNSAEKELELDNLLKAEYADIVANHPNILNRDNLDIVVNQYCTIPMNEIERMWDTMLGKYVWLSKDYIVANIKKDAVNNVWYIEFDSEKTSISIAS